MKISAWLLSGFAVTATAQWFETLEAQGLLGSHFGIPGVGAQYDYVILGGGTAGLTLARRLAEDSRYTVAVIEAGDFYEFANGNNTAVPGLSAAFLGSNPTLRNPYLDWYQPFEPQPQMADRSGVFSSGKVLGGGSARNLMLFTRAPKGALKKWAELVGDDSYEFDNLLPFYQKSTSYTPPSDKRLPNSTAVFDESFWSDEGGPVQVGYPNWVNAISTWAEGALEEIGLKNLPGFADGNVFGYAYSPLALDSKTQTRSSAETSYLREALAQTTNLNVYKNAIAKKIIFDGNKAVAATVETGNVQFRINATREVIVSAGTFRSPQLLMVSGIGPRETLEELGIEVLSDLPGVGQNLWDHISFTPSYVVDVVTHSALSNREFLGKQTRDYLSDRTGMLTNNGGDILAFADFPAGLISNSTRKDLDAFATDWPDIEYIIRDNYFGSGRDRSEIPTDGRNYASPATSLMAPFSRGNITIVSKDTNDYPVFSPNWLLDPRDQEMAVAAFKLARSLFANSTAMRDIIVGPEVFPGFNVTSDKDILDWSRKNAATINHATGTCAMGRPNDTLAVVDSQARVYGVQNLRVVDASTFPVLPACHPMATVYALAEKIAHIILQGSA